MDKIKKQLSLVLANYLLENKLIEDNSDGSLLEKKIVYIKDNKIAVLNTINITADNTLEVLNTLINLDIITIIFLEYIRSGDKNIPIENNHLTEGNLQLLLTTDLFKNCIMLNSDGKTLEINKNSIQKLPSDLQEKMTKYLNERQIINYEYNNNKILDFLNKFNGMFLKSLFKEKTEDVDLSIVSKDYKINRTNLEASNKLFKDTLTQVKQYNEQSLEKKEIKEEKQSQDEPIKTDEKLSIKDSSQSDKDIQEKRKPKAQEIIFGLGFFAGTYGYTYYRGYKAGFDKAKEQFNPNNTINKG